MKFLIITHAIHKIRNNEIYAYAPYVREMNLWLKHIGEVRVIAPIQLGYPNNIETKYEHNHLNLRKIPNIQFTSLLHIFISFFKLPIIFFTILNECRKADHIHLRCPGNIGLIGCIAQVFFPKKFKTAKYAGNWDPKAKQPRSYKFQKWLLSNTTLTKRMQVLVYGKWNYQSKNIKSFFTATFEDSEKEDMVKRDYQSILNFVFIGSLVSGKRPLLAIQIIESLLRNKMKVRLDLYGDGNLKNELLSYIQSNNLEDAIHIHGNQTKGIIKEHLKTAHFSILPSKSEGWPKAIAEGMFYGTIPICTYISCVPYMLDYGKRGILIEGNLDQAIVEIEKTIKYHNRLEVMAKKALNWSQKYTLDTFESEIAKLLNNK